VEQVLITPKILGWRPRVHVQELKMRGKEENLIVSEFQRHSQGVLRGGQYSVDKTPSTGKRSLLTELSTFQKMFKFGSADSETDGLLG
jgi:hypothetical protein